MYNVRSTNVSFPNLLTRPVDPTTEILPRRRDRLPSVIRHLISINVYIYFHVLDVFHTRIIRFLNIKTM
jgi:hypothetical protein